MALTAIGAVLTTGSLSLLTWNWDAQGGCLICPIGLLYLVLFVKPAVWLLVDAGKSEDAYKQRAIRRWVAVLVVFSIGGIAWALTLPSPIQRRERLECYQATLPYAVQPGCRK